MADTNRRSNGHIDYEELAAESLLRARAQGPFVSSASTALAQAVTGLGFAILNATEQRREELNQVVVDTNHDPMKDYFTQG